ncbi:SDR family oxidoreductase [Bacillus daqingensis]|uniref:SDR family oxidoreductase n=1 Tax=Bacillus daqingensis TaxID=872396 RepID=A0ABV9NX18_9BACI
MDMKVKGRSVVVLAASKGLGKATAEAYAQEGASVVIASRSREELEQTAAEIRQKTGSRVEAVPCDVNDLESIRALMAKSAELHDGIDVLITNAGGPPPGTFDSITDEQWQQSFQQVLLSVTRLVREALPWMRKAEAGRIVMIASSSVKQPIDGLILSNTFRAGLSGLAKSLSQELAAENILVNIVGPGRIGTDRLKQMDTARAERTGTSVEELQKQAQAEIPAGRYGTPDEFAQAVVFLGSGSNTYITGQTLLVDGGLVKAF